MNCIDQSQASKFAVDGGRVEKVTQRAHVTPEPKQTLQSVQTLAAPSPDANIIYLVAGRPKDEDPHIKQYTKKRKKVIEYIVSVNLDELGIDKTMFDELKALFELFDQDRDGVLILAEFEKVLRALGRACKDLGLMLHFEQ